MSTPEPARPSSPREPPGPTAHEPIPSSVFLSTFIPTLIVLVYALLAIYTLRTTVSRLLTSGGSRISSFRRRMKRCVCRGNRSKGEYRNVNDDVEGEPEPELAPAPEPAQGHTHRADGDTNVQQHGPPLSAIARPGSQPGSRPRRPRPAPLSLRTGLSTSTFGSSVHDDDDGSLSINVAKYFDPHTRRLNEDIILHPSTGLDALCGPVPRPAPCSCGSGNNVKEWIDWVIDWGILRVQRWLEGSRSGNGGEYQILPVEDNGLDRSGDTDGVELETVVSWRR